MKLMDQQKRLMILGSLDEFTGLVELAKSRNIYTVVCDGYPNGPAKKAADQAYDIDVRQIDAIADICRVEKINGIVTSFSDLLFECMVKIADKAGLPCYLKPEQLPCYRNKSAMKQLFNELKIPTARYLWLEKDFDPQTLNALTFPIVTKPVDMYGSRGLYVLNRPEEVKRYFNTICSSSDIQEILVEEYNSGFEFNMMTWVKNSRIHVLSIADREKTAVGKKCIPISTRNVYPSRLIHFVYDDALSILETFISATGQSDGPLSMQFFWSPGKGIQVCEIAGRFFGYEHELVEYSGGLSLEKLLLDYTYQDPCLSDELSSHSAFLQNCSAVLYFQGRDGIVDDQSAAAQLKNRRRVRKLQLFYEEGETISPHGPQPYAARCYIAGKTRKEIDAETRKILDRMSIKDSSGQELLYQNELTDYSEIPSEG